MQADIEDEGTRRGVSGISDGEGGSSGDDDDDGRDTMAKRLKQEAAEVNIVSLL